MYVLYIYIFIYIHVYTIQKTNSSNGNNHGLYGVLLEITRPTDYICEFLLPDFASLFKKSQQTLISHQDEHPERSNEALFPPFSVIEIKDLKKSKNTSERV